MSAALVGVPPGSPKSAVAVLPTSVGTTVPEEVDTSTLPQESETRAASVAVEHTEEHQDSDQLSERDDSKKDDHQQPGLQTDTDAPDTSKEAERAFLDLFQNLQNTNFPGNRLAKDIGLAHRLASLEDERVNDKLKRSPSVSEKDNADSDADDDDESNGAIAILNRVAWPQFKRRYREKRNPSQEHAIDVLDSNPVIPYEVWNDRVARSHPQHLDSRDRRIRLFRLFGEQDPFGDFGDSHGSDSAALNEPATTTTMAQSPQGSYQSIPERIRINGEPLKQLLEKTLDVDFKEGPIVLLKPFKLLVKYGGRIRNLHTQLERKFGQQSSQSANLEGQDHLEDIRGLYPGEDNEVGDPLLDEYGTKQAYQQLRCLIEFMDHELGTLKHFADASATKISFYDLWHIFQVGVPVVTAHKPVDAYRVLHVTGGRPYLSPPKDEEEEGNETIMKAYRVPAKSSDFVITCYQLGFDGNRFGPVAKSFSIQKYDGLQDIRSLPIYPLTFARDPSDLRTKLFENGKTFIRLSKVGHVLYRGLNLHEAEEIDSEIIVDFHAALWDNQDKDDGWQGKYEVDFGIKTLPNANEAEVVMVSRGGCKVPGCCENDQVFNDLDLDHRFMEEYLAENEFPTTDARYLPDDPDLIPDGDLILFPHQLFAFVLKDRKWGKGLIVLLHGAPGVGKTSTAECVADLCRKPLYPITCGDLGITAVEVETRLKRIFIQAQKWECVLLLDEASVSEK
ncbi:hypothetical protein Neosp_012696 [[Neocosmospora] mangrovei]